MAPMRNLSAGAVLIVSTWDLVTRLYRELSVGITGNVYYGNVVTDEKRNLVWNSEALSRVEVLDSTRYSGFNATVGFLYTGEKLRGALVLRTPFNLGGNSDSTTYRYTTFNNVPLAAMSDTVYVNNMTSKLEMPLMIGLGGAYNVTEKFILSADVEYRKFNGKIIQNLRAVDGVEFTASGDRVEHFVDRNPNWSNVIQMRLGLEYTMHTSVGEVPFRIGARNEALPYGDITGYDIIYEGQKGAPANVNDSTRISYRFYYNSNKVTGYSVSIGNRASFVPDNF